MYGQLYRYLQIMGRRLQFRIRITSYLNVYRELFPINELLFAKSDVISVLQAIYKYRL